MNTQIPDTDRWTPEKRVWWLVLGAVSLAILTMLGLWD